MAVSNRGLAVDADGNVLEPHGGQATAAIARKSSLLSISSS